MKQSAGVKEILLKIFDQYKKFFEKTFSTSLLLTVIVFVVAALLFKYTKYATDTVSSVNSLLQCFYSRFSYKDTYSIIDWAKSVYLAVIACFAISFFRAQKNENGISSDFFFRNLNPRAVFIILLTLVIVCALDPAIYFLDRHVNSLLHDNDGARWFHSVIWECRINIPIILFAFTIKIIWQNSQPVSFRQFMVLLISIWLFNEFSYELMILVRSVAIRFATMFIESNQTKFLVESVLGIPLLAFYFIGFAVVMFVPLNSTEPAEVDILPAQ